MLKTAPPPPRVAALPARSPVPFMDLKAQAASVRDEALAAFTAIFDSAGYILGSHVADFEKAFADYCGVKHCIALNTGTSALHLALIGAGVGPGDEVITTPLTFVATTWAVSYVGATPVFVDADPITGLMDVSHVERAITRKTKAILPVHLYGQPCDLAPLLAIADAHGLKLIEDAAQAHGATYRGKPVGGFGQSGCFSFYPGKNLGAAGEGGAVVTNDEALTARFRSLRDHAQPQRYHHTEVGFNYRMDALQGAVLGIKLKRLAAWTERRRELAARYLELLADLPLDRPVVAEGRDPVWHLFVIRHPDRDGLRIALDQAGVQTGLHYPVPVHLQPAYQHLGHIAGAFPAAERFARECLSLPLYPEMTACHQDAVVAALSDALVGGH
jgi:dTDP-4-amino-4,6-dideoxygalactose transaminase